MEIKINKEIRTYKETILDYVSDAPVGHGLIKVGGGIVPFVNEFPKDTALYWLMTTKPGEE